LHSSIVEVHSLTLRQAEEYLYKHNTFIVASFEWPEFDRAVDGERTYSEQLILPIVTDKYVARMKHHTVRLHITKNMDPTTAGVSFERPSKIPIYSVLLVANDFRAFCFSLRYRVGALHGFAVVVADGAAPGRQLNIIGVTESHQKLKPPSLKIEFRDTCFRAANSNLQRNLLGSLRRVVSPSLQVSLKGAIRLPDDMDAQSIKLAMGPTAVNHSALAWYFFGVMLEGKQLADAAVLWGEPQIAIRLYCTISEQVKQWEYSVNNQGSRAAAVTLTALRLDILISVAYMYVKMGDMENLEYTCTDLEKHLATFVAVLYLTADEVIMQAEARIRHIILLGELFTFDPSRITGNRVAVKTVKEVIKLLSEHSDGLYTQHDVRIMEAAENKEDPATNHMSRELCSACKLGPIISAVHQSAEFPQKPDHLVGLQNIKTLRELSADTKKEINDMQRKFRAQVTPWD
jgi:hypothetical protein